MIKLGDYFAPLNLETLSYSLLLFFFFDILGTFIKKRIAKGESQSRIINWLIGFGFFIFVWFILSLITTYTKIPVLTSIAILLSLTLPEYIKSKEYLKIVRELWSLRIPILIILPFLPAIFVKASTPPYYADEMAYQFISPSTLATLAPIKYTGGIYADLPRIQNLFYEIIFSLTKTYSVARLTNFTILVTSMLYAFKILKKNFGFLPGFLFVFIFFSLPQDIVLTSTLGYVDVPAYSYLAIALVSAVDFLNNRKENFLVLSALFWAMNLGTKYTGVSAFVSFVFVFLTILTVKRKEYLKIFRKKLLVKLGFIFLLFGGYWYVKNFVVFGNPIYPFIFPCWGKFSSHCQTGGSFFGEWTMKVTLANAYPILKLLLSTNIFLQMMVVATPLIAFFTKSSKIRLILFFLLSTVAIELLILKFFSGFYVRYHQHMQHYLIAALVISVANREALRQGLAKALVTILILTSLATYIYTIRYSNSLRFLNWYEINYSIGKIDIYDWVEWKFPDMKATILWCEDPPDGLGTKLARFDPDLIWYDYGGYMRVFMTGCKYVNPPLEGIEVEKVLQKTKEGKMKFWIASPYRCIPDSDVKPKYDYEGEHQLYLRKLNNKIICNSEEIKPNLYYFDYEKL